jgi:tRNA-specific adenosine deaminase 2
LDIPAITSLTPRKGTRHAEFVAIADILQKYNPEILKETDLYVTVEPCIMCASALRQYGIRAVYFGCFNDRFGGTGGVLRIHDEYVPHTCRKLTDSLSKSIDPPYKALPGPYREEAIMLLRKFYVQENEKAPEPRPKKTRELKTDIMPLQQPRLAA